MHQPKAASCMLHSREVSKECKCDPQNKGYNGKDIKRTGVQKKKRTAVTCLPRATIPSHVQGIHQTNNIRAKVQQDTAGGNCINLYLPDACISSLIDTELHEPNSLNYEG